MASRLYHNKIMWSFCGFTDQKDAEEAVAEQLVWFKRSFPDWKEWTIHTSTTRTPDGWRANLDAEKDMN